MSKQTKETESITLTEKELIQRGKDYIELDAVSRWVDDQFFKAESPYTISDKFWRASQKNLRKLKPVVKELEELRTDIGKAWKKKVDFNEKVYELGNSSDESTQKTAEYKSAKAYVFHIDSEYRQHSTSEETTKEYNDFYQNIPLIDFYKVDASVIEALEIPFDNLYLVEKYYKC